MIYRRFKNDGRCLFCGKTISGSSISKHVETCRRKFFKIDEDDASEGPYATHILITSNYDRKYWLHAAVVDYAEFADIDDFLRRNWLECCGHLSSFEFGEMILSSDPDGDFFDFGMDIPFAAELEIGDVVHYTYDFGDSTDLEIEVMDEFPLPSNRDYPPVFLMAHNLAPDLLCDCGALADDICHSCYDTALCSKCAELHDCGDEFLVKIVNSPRCGQCAYDGPVPFDTLDYTIDDALKSSIDNNSTPAFDEPASPMRRPPISKRLIPVLDALNGIGHNRFAPSDLIEKTYPDASLNEFEDMLDELEAYIEDSPDFLDFDVCASAFHLPSAFNGARFLIKPTQDELEDGVLFPGHRFIPFTNAALKPKDVTVFFNGSPIPKTRVAKNLESLMIYHSILGPLHALMYLSMDAGLILPPMDFQQEITVTAFDMKSFYNEHDFKEGDAIIADVQDFSTAQCSFSHISAEELEKKRGLVPKWCALFADGLAEALDEYGSDATVNDQLAFAFLKSDFEFLTSNPVIHIGGFLALTDRFILTSFQGEGMIWPSDADIPEGADEPPDLFPDDPDELNALFEELDLDGFDEFMEEPRPPDENSEDLFDFTKYMGFNFLPGEVEFFMLDELFMQEKKASADNVWDVCFDDRLEEPENAPYVKRMRTLFNGLWEKTVASYDQSKDMKRGPLRNDVIYARLDTWAKIDHIKELEGGDFEVIEDHDLFWDLLILSNQFGVNMLDTLRYDVEKDISETKRKTVKKEIEFFKRERDKLLDDLASDLL